MIDFDRFVSVLGRFLVVWELLGGSFGGLGGSWAALGRLLGGLGAVLGRHGSPRVNFVDFRASKVLSTPSFGGAKGGQDEAKIGPKRDQNR